MRGSAREQAFPDVLSNCPQQELRRYQKVAKHLEKPSYGPISLNCLAYSLETAPYMASQISSNNKFC
jgi:hypothetical protein